MTLTTFREDQWKWNFLESKWSAIDIKREYLGQNHELLCLWCRRKAAILLSQEATSLKQRGVQHKHCDNPEFKHCWHTDSPYVCWGNFMFSFLDRIPRASPSSKSQPLFTLASPPAIKPFMAPSLSYFSGLRVRGLTLYELSQLWLVVIFFAAGGDASKLKYRPILPRWQSDPEVGISDKSFYDLLQP